MKATNYIEIPDELDDDYSNDDLYNIDSWGADLSFRELVTMYDEEELMKPELQRNYVWDRVEASRFIESLLLGLPVPSIFLAKTKNEKTLIIDGYQRIMSVYEFINTGIFSKDGKVFNLSNTKRINERWRGKTFLQLTDAEQRKIKSTTIHAIIFRQTEPKDDDTSLFQVFERINTGGRTLTPQEIRNCVYQGPLNNLLFDLNEWDVWRKLYGSKTHDSRMKDMEFILRFFVLSQPSLLELTTSSISLKKSLNEFMGEKKENTASLVEKRREEFQQTLNFIHENIGDEAFFNVSQQGSIVRKLHPTIFDAIAIATFHYLRDKGRAVKNLKERRLRLLNDEEFKKYTTIRTTNLESIKGRIRKATEYLYGSSF